MCGPRLGWEPMKLIMKVKITLPFCRQALTSALLMLAMSACPPSTKPDGGLTVLPDGGVPLARSEFLRAAAECSLRAARDFQTTARAFAAAPSQQTWRDAMRAWQVLEPMQFGPTASSVTPGGLDLRDQLYSWPLTSRCAVDETLTTSGYAGGVSTLLINRRGLAAAEYLLFSDPGSASCGDTAAWSALAPAEQAARKQAYAAQVALDVEARAGELVDAWGPFVDTLGTAGPDNATYPTVQGALNRVSDAVFYLDTSMKDLKLAPPLGLRGCLTPPCLDQLESQWAHHNTVNLRSNLDGLQRLLRGCQAQHQGPGFDDLLDAQGAFSLSERLAEKETAAGAALDALGAKDLSDALVSEPTTVRALYDAFKGITDLLKSEFITVLDVELPMGLEGDND